MPVSLSTLSPQRKIHEFPDTLEGFGLEFNSEGQLTQIENGMRVRTCLFNHFRAS